MKYNEAFKGLLDLPIQQKDQIYQEYIINVPKMWEFKKFMDDKGVELLIRDTTPNHKMYEWYFGKVKLPVTEKIATQAVRLPTYPELTDKEVNYIINCVKEYYEKI